MFLSFALLSEILLIVPNIDWYESLTESNGFDRITNLKNIEYWANLFYCTMQAVI